jgi:uncharacterized protein
VLALALVVPPAPTGHVNDHARLLKPAEVERLEASLAERERATGAQMVIAIFPSLEGESLEDFSIRLAQQWRIGRKGLDDGVILLVFVRDRRMRMEVGYGLEPVIPDAVAGAIIRETLAPAFREQRWAAGLEAAADAVFARVGKGQPAARGPRAPSAPRSGMAMAALALIVIVMVGMALAAQRTARRLQGRRRGYTAGPQGWYVPPPIWYGGRRGGWGGGWSGGGGGGFSGGGGSFGGGGASGQW